MFCYGFGLYLCCLVWANGFITFDGWLWLWALGLQICEESMLGKFPLLNCWLGGGAWLSFVFCYGFGFGLCFGCLVWAHRFITLDVWLWLWVRGLQSLRFRNVLANTPWESLGASIDWAIHMCTSMLCISIHKIHEAGAAAFGALTISSSSVTAQWPGAMSLPA